MKKTFIFASMIAGISITASSLSIAQTEARKGPGKSQSKNQAALDQQLRAIIDQQGLTGTVAGADALPSISDPIAQLGMKLFFSKALGGEKTVACASCHYPKLGGGDRLSLPIGVNAVDPDVIGPNRQSINNEIVIPRNSPTIFNSGLAQNNLFWDGRVQFTTQEDASGNEVRGISTPDSGHNVIDINAGTSLTSALSRFPVTSQDEMRGEGFPTATNNQEVREHIASRIGDTGVLEGDLATNDWLAQFREAFDSTEDAGTLITFDSISMALGQYQSSLVLINNPWNNYVAGDLQAIRPAQKRGAILFYTPVEEGGAGCVACHGGDRFTNEAFFNIAFPQYGPGKEDSNEDFGRFTVDGEDTSRFAFRVPSLLNVGVTKPYGHTGAYETLSDVVAHYVNPEAQINHFFDQGGACQLTQFKDNANCDALNNNAKQNTQAALDRLLASPFVAPQLDEKEQTDLVAFLRALTDPCVKDKTCIGQWIPRIDVTNPDNLRISFSK